MWCVALVLISIPTLLVATARSHTWWLMKIRAAVRTAESRARSCQLAVIAMCNDPGWRDVRHELAELAKELGAIRLHLQEKGLDMAQIRKEVDVVVRHCTRIAAMTPYIRDNACLCEFLALPVAPEDIRRELAARI